MFNWWEACNSKSWGVDWKEKAPEEVRKKIVGKTLDEVKDFLSDYLEIVYKKDKKLETFQKKLPKSWEENKEKILDILENIMGKFLVPKKLICYYTSFPRGPYDMNDFSWIQIPFFNNPKTGEFSVKKYISGIVHELMHFQFHHYYWEEAKKLGLSETQVGHLKEASTVLMNLYYDGILGQDYGYDIHQRLRKDLIKIWGETGNFENFLVKSVDLIKVKYSSLD